MTSNKSTNVAWHHTSATRAHRENRNGHKGAILWFTDLSGSGKSTLAHNVEAALHQRGCMTIVLDGDNVHHGLCGDLTFSDEDRKENIRRIGEVAKLFAEAGVIVLTAFISPFRDDRRRVRDLAPDDFVEIHVDCDISICEERDVKGLYKKARAGDIKDFTGISSPYEVPEQAELTVNTGVNSLAACVAQVTSHLTQSSVIEQEAGQQAEIAAGPSRTVSRIAF